MQRMYPHPYLHCDFGQLWGSGEGGCLPIRGVSVRSQGWLTRMCPWARHLTKHCSCSCDYSCYTWGLILILRVRLANMCVKGQSHQNAQKKNGLGKQVFKCLKKCTTVDRSNSFYCHSSIKARFVEYTVEILPPQLWIFPMGLLVTSDSFSPCLACLSGRSSLGRFAFFSCFFHFSINFMVSLNLKSLGQIFHLIVNNQK